MFKSWLLEKLAGFKKIISRFWMVLCRQLKYISTIFPATTVIAIIYIIVTVSGGLIDSISAKINNSKIYGLIINFLLFLIVPILQHIFDNIVFFLFVGLLVVIIGIAGFVARSRERSRFPVIGIPTKDNIAILIALFKIRSFEIANIYSIVQRYKQESKDGSWIQGFLEQYFEYYNSFHPNSPFDKEDVGKKEQRKQQNKQDIAVLLSNKFCFAKRNNYCSQEEIIKEKSNLKDLMIAVKLEHEAFSKDVLSAMCTYGILNNTLEALIKKYKKFETSSMTLFIHDKKLFNWFKHKAINADDQIEKIWTEILLALRAGLLMLDLKDQNNFDVNQLIKEINILSHMHRASVIAQYMKDQACETEYRFSNSVSDDDVQFLIATLKNHPVEKFFS